MGVVDHLGICLLDRHRQQFHTVYIDIVDMPNLYFSGNVLLPKLHTKLS